MWCGGKHRLWSPINPMLPPPKRLQVDLMQLDNCHLYLKKKNPIQP